MRYKTTTLASILIVSAIGVCIPLLGKVITSLEKHIFFVIKAFAVRCLWESDFALPMLLRIWLHLALCTAIGTLMVDTYTATYFQKHHSDEIHTQTGDMEKEAGHELLHAQATHGHFDGLFRWSLLLLASSPSSHITCIHHFFILTISILNS